MKIKPANTTAPGKTATCAIIAFLSAATIHAQQVTPATSAPPPERPIPIERTTPTGDTAPSDDIVELSRFVVSTDRDTGYAAATTLAGTRLRTDLKDVGAAISVVTGQFMADTGSVNAKDVLVYTTNTEIGGIGGNTSGVTLTSSASSPTALFDAPASSTRVRGLSSADLTRDFFGTSIPMDMYNTERIDISRGANAILFGLGSPSGIINNQLKTADTRARKYHFDGSIGRYDSYRGVLDINQPIIHKELAVRVIGLADKRYYQQQPAYEQDKRLYATAKWEKNLFKQAFTQIQASYEMGRQNSNRPRVTPPQDGLTVWYDPEVLNKYSYDGATSNLIRADAYKKAHITWPGRWMNANTLGSIFSDPYSGTQGVGDKAQSMVVGYNHPTIGLLNQWGPTSYATAGGSNLFFGNRRFALAHGLPVDSVSMAGLWRQQEILDSSVYDFYDQLLDGPNKWEKADFDALNIAMRQTFFNDKLGFEVVYDRQNYDRSSFQPFYSEGATILVDAMKTFFDGTPNPNYGRPMVTSDSGGSEGNNDREVFRATAFGVLDFRENEGWMRYLGKHVFTGVYSKQEENNFSRGFKGYAYDYALLNDYLLTPVTTYQGYAVTRYLGDRIDHLSSPAGAHIGNARARQDPARNATSQYWDANHQTWVTITPTLYNYRDDIDKLYSDASKSEAKTESIVAVWQAYLFNDLLVGTLGWRQDDYQQYNAPAALKAPTGQVLPYASNWKLSSTPTVGVKDSTISWSVVGHAPAFVKKWLPRGTDVSLSYNRSQNFRPSAVGANPYGEVFDPPQGTTRDIGMLISLANNKFTLRITNFKTTQKNDASTLLDPYYLGNNFTIFLNGLKHPRTPERIINKWFGFQPGDPRYMQERSGGANNPVLTPQEQSDRAAWFSARTREEWLANPLVDQKLVDTWALDLNRADAYWTCTRPANIKNLSDTESTGWEGELIYNPTSNWRMMLNVSQQKAKRMNIGKDLESFIAANMPLWTDGDGVMATNMSEVNGFEDVTQWDDFNRTQGSENMRYIYVPYLSMLDSNGSNVPELRQWRANFVTNYDFKRGFLKGFSIGGAVRWQDKMAIGYRPKLKVTPVSKIWINDVSSPVYSPTETNYDLNLRYTRKIFRGKIQWTVQLNIRDIFGSDKLIPIATQPDGSVASARIPQSNRWTLTNSFDF